MPHSLREEQLLTTILERASVDQQFRQRLLTEPARVIEQSFGVVIPTRFRIRFVEKDAQTDALVVLPDFKGRTDELSNGDLDTVAGGVGTGGGASWSDDRCK